MPNESGAKRRIPPSKHNTQRIETQNKNFFKIVLFKDNTINPTLYLLIVSFPAATTVISK